MKTDSLSFLAQVKEAVHDVQGAAGVLAVLAFFIVLGFCCGLSLLKIIE